VESPLRRAFFFSKPPSGTEIRATRRIPMDILTGLGRFIISFFNDLDRKLARLVDDRELARRKRLEEEFRKRIERSHDQGN
jgi:hypothetical protein